MERKTGPEGPEIIEYNLDREPTAEEIAAFDMIKKIQDAGFGAYIAGGAVRDMLLGHIAHDIDIATSAKPEEVQRLFPAADKRGKAFGVVAVRPSEDFEFEVATFRSDIGTEDHRRPAEVRFTTAEEDAQRRDFTINALFYDPIAKQVIDYVGGVQDLKNQIVRFVGEPSFRIQEDYLRMLRAIRFTHRLDFALDDGAAQAIRENAGHIKGISAERIREETTNILTGPRRHEALMQMESLGLLQKILPEACELRDVPQPREFHSEGDAWVHTLMALESLGENPSAELVWTVLLHDIGKPKTLGRRDEEGKTSVTFFEHDTLSAKMAKEILGKLKFSNDFIDAVSWAISQHMRIIHAFRGMSERKQKKLFTHPYINLLLDLTKADLGASLRPDMKPDLSMYEDAVSLKEKFEEEASEEEKQQVAKFTLINGKDIMEILGLQPGPKVGEIKSKIEEAYLNGDISTRDQALEMLETFK